LTDADRLAHYLERCHLGKSKAITAVAMARESKYNWELVFLRDESRPGDIVWALSHKLRDEGIPVLSCESGYFYARTRAEVEEYRESLRRRAMAMLETCKALESCLVNDNPQGNFFDL